MTRKELMLAWYETLKTYDTWDEEWYGDGNMEFAFALGKGYTPEAASSAATDLLAFSSEFFIKYEQCGNAAKIKMPKKWFKDVGNPACTPPSELQECLEHLAAMLNCFNTPIGRRNMNDTQLETCWEAQAFLDRVAAKN